jgi:undecaprenol kinase
MRQYINDRKKSFQFAFEGLAHVFRTQQNARIHLFVIAVVIFLALWLAIPLSDAAIVFLAIGMVLGLEFMNTALEALVDLISPDHHPLAKIVKDVCAGAVLICAIASVLVGICLFGPPLFAKLNIVTH